MIFPDGMIPAVFMIFLVAVMIALLQIEEIYTINLRRCMSKLD
jgi:hypothetical protein